MFTLPRFGLGLLGGILLPGIFVLVASNPESGSGPLVAVAVLIFLATLWAELLERYLFFSVVDAPRMPGGVSA